MNNLIFYVLLKMLFELKKRNPILEAFIKQQYVIRYNKIPSLINYKKLYDFLDKIELYHDLPFSIDGDSSDNVKSVSKSDDNDSKFPF